MSIANVLVTFMINVYLIYSDWCVHLFLCLFSFVCVHLHACMCPDVISAGLHVYA